MKEAMEWAAKNGRHFRRKIKQGMYQKKGLGAGRP
jgi:hypothetical protein